jgi:rSAM/selenodomain-associated transferase 2
VSDVEAGISVLIPVLNEGETIGGLLAGLVAMDFSEIIVCDGGSTDATRDIVLAARGVILVRSGRGRGLQINAAASAARQPILLILHADTRLPANAAQLVRDTLRDKRVAAGCFRLAFDRASATLAFYAWCSRFESRFTTFGDQAYFTTRSTFEAAGRAPDWPLLEDVALRERLKAHGRFVKRSETVVTSARRFTKRGVVFQQVLNTGIIAAYYCGVPVNRLAAIYGMIR